LKIRAADAKEVGVGNPAEETCCYPNENNVTLLQLFVNKLSFASWFFVDPKRFFPSRCRWQIQIVEWLNRCIANRWRTN
jgi:hypothetical protein